MTMHVQRFVDRLRSLESRGAKDFIMSMSDAKDLHADITRLLLHLQSMQELTQNKQTENTPISVEIKGGLFK